MNFLKPTKIKVFGTVAVYFAGVLKGWVSAGLFLLFFPDFLSDLEEEVIGVVQERAQDFPLAGGVGIAVLDFVLEIILLYGAICGIVYLVKKKMAA